MMKIKSGDIKRGIYNSCLGAALVVALLLLGPSDSYGQFPMGNTLAPIPGNDYPISYANDAKGGHHQVANIAARNAITTLRRQVGMLCTVLENSALSNGSGIPQTFQLICADIQSARDNNANWVPFITGGGTLAWSALTGNPFAINTSTTGQLLNYNGTNWVNVDKISIPLNGFGSATGNISMGDGLTNNFIINNLADPLANQDAATKKYVDVNSGNNTGLVTAETNRAIAAEGANTTLIGTNTSAIASEATTARTAEGANATNIALKANIASPVFTGNPTALTPAIKDSTTSLATTAFVTAAVSASTIPDATNVLKGKIMLAGDLAGTADLPVVADLAITTTKVAEGSITTTKIADANITTSKILDANITTSKIADGSVTYAKIQNITPARLLGNPTGAAGASHEIALGKGLNFSNDSLYTNSTAARDTFTADIKVTSSPGLGIYATNATIPAKGKTANEILLLALTPLVPAVYTKPTANLSSSLPAGTYEIYSPLSITLTGTYNINDGGAAGAPVYSGGVGSTTLSANPDVIAAGSFASSISYIVTYSYAAGVGKTDNLGAPSGTAVAAGSAVSNVITYTPMAMRYWGRCAGSIPTSAEITNSADVTNGGGGTDLNNSNANTCTINAAAVKGTITNYYFYAYPATLNPLVSAFIGGFESLPTLNLQTISVVKNGKPISYKVYVSNVPTSGDVNLIAK